MGSNSSIPNVPATRSLLIQQIDLNDYYRNDPIRQIICCRICKLDIPRRDVFKHTISKRHKYNKLFVAVLQNRCRNEDMDFIVLNIDQLACRYCDVRLMIKSDSDDLIDSHIQDVRHIQDKQAFLNGIGSNGVAVSTAGYSSKLLQPLDSFVTHDTKTRKRMNKKAQKIQNETSLLVTGGQLMNELGERARNNVVQNTDHKYSLISRDYQKKWGKELPKCITIREGDTYTCTICCIEIPPGANNLGIHINGKKHTKKMLREFRHLSSEDVGIEEAITDLKATNDIVENNIPQSSVVYEDEIAQFDQELKDCISSGENCTLTCTVCNTGIPNTSKNINEHLDGKKHREKIQKLIESKKRKLELKDVNKLIPAPVGIVKNGRYRCTICNVWVVNNVKTIKDHNNGKKHVKIMLQTERMELAAIKIL